MRRVLSFDSACCSGCMTCMANCSLKHEGLNGPTSSRIRIDVDPFAARWPATFCRQCTKAPCAAACPTGAIQRNESKEYWTIDYDLCIGCRECVDACPFGACTFDPITDKVLKCETCAGDPLCAQICPTGALRWHDVTDRTPAVRRMASS